MIQGDAPCQKLINLLLIGPILSPFDRIKCHYVQQHRHIPYLHSFSSADKQVLGSVRSRKVIYAQHLLLVQTSYANGLIDQIWISSYSNFSVTIKKNSRMRIKKDLKAHPQSKNDFTSVRSIRNSIFLDLNTSEKERNKIRRLAMAFKNQPMQ